MKCVICNKPHKRKKLTCSPPCAKKNAKLGKYCPDRTDAPEVLMRNLFLKAELR